MILLTIFFTSLVMGFSGALMPGPLLTVTINESLRKGAKVGFLIALGHAMLELALVIGIFFGLGKVIDWPLVKGLIGIIGGAFLVWMAYGMLRQVKRKVNFDLSEQADAQGLHPVIAGVTVSASNPYWSLWWVTAGAGSLMFAADYGRLGTASFYFGHILSDFIWYGFIAVIVAGGKKFLTPALYRVILRICGLFLLGLAGYFIYSGVNFLMLFR